MGWWCARVSGFGVSSRRWLILHGPSALEVAKPTYIGHRSRDIGYLLLKFEFRSAGY